MTYIAGVFAGHDLSRPIGQRLPSEALAGRLIESVLGTPGFIPDPRPDRCVARFAGSFRPRPDFPLDFRYLLGHTVLGVKTPHSWSLRGQTSMSSIQSIPFIPQPSPKVDPSSASVSICEICGRTPGRKQGSAAGGSRPNHPRRKNTLETPLSLQDQRHAKTKLCLTRTLIRPLRPYRKRPEDRTNPVHAHPLPVTPSLQPRRRKSTLGTNRPPSFDQLRDQLKCHQHGAANLAGRPRVPFKLTVIATSSNRKAAPTSDSRQPVTC